MQFKLRIPNRLIHYLVVHKLNRKNLIELFVKICGKIEWLSEQLNEVIF